MKEHYKHLIKLTISLAVVALNSVIIMSVDPSKMNDPRAQELLISTQEGITQVVPNILDILTNPFIHAGLIVVGIWVYMIVYRDDKDQ